MPTTVIILAAGQGKRMRSDLPKVLQPLAGRPILEHVLGAAAALKPREICIVHGHGGQQVKEAFAGRNVAWVEQAEQRGTGHAVKLALGKIRAGDVVLVLYGDVPLVRPETLKKLVSRAASGKLAVLTAEFDDPRGYGRIIRGPKAKGGGIVAIVEEKDASREQRAIREINTGLMACPAGKLARLVAQLKPNNAQREYYLTDVIGLAVKGRMPVVAVPAESEDEVTGINDKVQLAQAGQILRRRTARALMEAGVTLVDPERTDVHGTLTFGRDVVIHPNVLFEGNVRLGDGVLVEAFSRIRNANVGAGTIVHTHCVIEAGEIGKDCEIGPYARMRPGVVLVGDVKLGNFVEVKKSTIGRGSKANHLSYIGDATIGARVNVGAGTITCNYDGANKHQTIIEDEVFIGSDVQLIAPVTIGRGATVGAGATITKNVPPGELTISERKQVTRYGWKRPVKK
jgi:bifunctional UDP-N-acetylglucosamine pyrophosphorylase / glucosamine-1-phosphate N-acetyltransferase